MLYHVITTRKPWDNPSRDLVGDIPLGGRCTPGLRRSRCLSNLAIHIKVIGADIPHGRLEPTPKVRYRSASAPLPGHPSLRRRSGAVNGGFRHDWRNQARPVTTSGCYVRKRDLVVVIERTSRPNNLDSYHGNSWEGREARRQYIRSAARSTRLATVHSPP